MSQEFKKTVTIKNRNGLHVRTATQLVKTANQFNCQVFIDREGYERANAKSIMSVLTLAAPKGSKITLITQGDEGEKCLHALVDLVDNRFGEDGE